MSEIIKTLPLEPRTKITERILDLVYSEIEKRSPDYARVLFLNVNEQDINKVHNALRKELLDVNVPMAKQYASSIIMTKAHKHHDFVKSNFKPRSYAFVAKEFSVFIGSTVINQEGEMQLHMYIKE